MGLNAGSLDREITLQTSTSTQSASGEPIVTWGAEETVWAQWLASGTSEVYKAAARLEGVIDGMFRIYWRDDISPSTTRIVWDDTIYDVKPPIEGGRHEWLDIPVSAISA